jgi:microsomal dipeptidase-like Zn-dependent dipeptidase
MMVVAVATGVTTPSPGEAAPAASAMAPGQRPRRDVPEDRYAMAGGCYAMAGTGTGGAVRAGPFFFQATDLGRYLLFTADAAYLAGSGMRVVNAAAASPDADWVVDAAPGGAFTLRLDAPTRTLVVNGDGTLALAPGEVTTDAAHFRFRRASGCATFPEIDIDVTGPYPQGASPIEEVRGFLDGHLHMMAFEYFGGRAHCGRPWHAYGVTRALVDCPDHMVANGSAAVMENLLSNGVPFGTHDPVGWPTFKDWPAPGSLTHEQVYYRWMERAWRGGLRMFVNLFVDNSVLCQAYPLKKNSCNEMDSVRLQNQDIRALERYVDAQSGGPGRGWFRIVTDPFEARRVMNDGRLAVVLGIEVSELFGCRLIGDRPQCTTADIDRQLAEVQAMGVRQLELVNKFDNALAGVAGDGGTLGLVINTGNFYDTGHFWDMASCDPGHTGVHDQSQDPVPGTTANQDALIAAGLQLAPAHAATPVYPPPPHCNALGLSGLGRSTIEQMMQRGLIFDPDHMSVLARQQSLAVVEARHYSGVISSHSWATPDAYPRIYALGGMTTPYAGNATGFVEAWRERRKYAPTGQPCFGFGYGADSNGLGAQGRPRGAAAKNPVTYPFTGFGGVTVGKQVSGQRVYDVNVDGVSHYGLYPDWIEDLRHLAGDQIIKDMTCGPEAYLAMWERAGGIAAAACHAPGELDALTPGMTAQEVLRTAGQPQQRKDLTFTYCLAAGGARVMQFDTGGRLVRDTATVAGTASSPSPLPVTGGRGVPWLATIGLAVLLGVRRLGRGHRDAWRRRRTLVP